MSLLGSIGSIAGGAIGSYFGGPAGGAAGSSFGSLLSKNADKIGQGIGDAISGLGSSALSYGMDLKQASKLMSMQYDMQKQLALNKYPWEVASLEAAGLNPILAATRGASAYTANAPVINAKRGQDVINSALAFGQIENLGAQNDLIKSQAMSASSTAKQIDEQTKVLARINRILDKHPEIALGQETNKMGVQGLKFAILDWLSRQLPVLRRLPGGLND